MVDRNDTSLEASLKAAGVLTIITGLIGLLPGAPSFPGPWWQKLLVALLALAIAGVGGLLIKKAEKHKDRRIADWENQRSENRSSRATS